MRFSLTIPSFHTLRHIFDRQDGPNLRTLRLNFAGWKDPTLAATYKNSLPYYEVEISAGRTAVGYPAGILQFHVLGGDGPQGTAVGAHIDVDHFPERIDMEGIRKFFEDIGVLVQ